jgi:hypothetical protein
MGWIIAVALIAVVLAAVAVFVGLWWIYRKPKKDIEITADKGKIDALVRYVENQKKEAEEKQRLVSLKKAEQKEKLEYFRQTREELKNNLRSKLDGKEWVPLQKILDSADKGGMGIYVLHNETKNKYYVGQEKALSARIKKHFEVEGIARDFLSGDKISVKTLSAAEIGEDYRLDHIEKVGIEIYNADMAGYNKTAGNL